VTTHRRKSGAQCDYELTLAGRWALVVTAAEAGSRPQAQRREFTRSFAVTCKAAKADYHACSVDTSTLPVPWVVRRSDPRAVSPSPGGGGGAGSRARRGPRRVGGGAAR
jgi:hypothetical protein